MISGVGPPDPMPDEKIEAIDIPEGISDELERLHCILMSDDRHKSEKDWARSKVDKIHEIFFQGFVCISRGGNE